MEFKDNLLVAQLGWKDQRILHNACSETVLTANQNLTPTLPAQRAIFLLAGASVALLASAGHRAAVAAGLIGPNGVTGLQYGLGLNEGGLTTIVQTTGRAWLISGAAMKQLLDRHPALLLAVSQYLWRSAQEAALLSARGHAQTVTQRLAGWIDRSLGHDLHAPLLLTHVHLAAMLGVRRASITSAAVELRELGLIDYERGRVFVVDHAKLRSIADGHR